MFGRYFVRAVALIKERYVNQGDDEDVKPVILVSWEVYRSGGCRNKVIRLLKVVEKDFVLVVFGVAILRGVFGVEIPCRYLPVVAFGEEV